MLQLGSNLNYRVGYYAGTWSIRFLSFGVVDRIVWSVEGQPKREQVYDPPMEVVPHDTLVINKEDMTPCW